MIQQNELIIFLLGMGGMLFVLVNRPRVERLPASRVLVASFFILLGGWLMTILEDLFWEDFLNLMEHISYALSSVFIALWCWRVFQKGEARA